MSFNVPSVPRAFEAVIPNPGGQLDPSHVYGRAGSVRQATARLAEGRHLLLDEPRRFGKSSFARLLVRTLSESDRFTGLYHSTQGGTTLNKLVEGTLGALRELPGTGRHRFVDAVSRVVESVEKVGPLSLSVAYERDPLAALRTVVADLDRTAEKRTQRLVICLDELTETVAEIGRADGDHAARELLAELRRLRETHRHVCWVFTGSIGFHHVLRAVGTTSSMINDMQRFALGPLDADWARWLAGSVLLGAGLERDRATEPVLLEAIADATDGIPILIHMLGQRCRDHETALDATSVRDTLESCFRSDQAQNLTHPLTRLDDYYGADAGRAREVLDHASLGPLTGTELRTVDGTDDDLLDRLEADHYLDRDTENRTTWKYPSLARLWRVRRRL